MPPPMPPPFPPPPSSPTRTPTSSRPSANLPCCCLCTAGHIFHFQHFAIQPHVPQIHYSACLQSLCTTVWEILHDTEQNTLHGKPWPVFVQHSHGHRTLCHITHQRLVRDWRHRQNFSMNSLPSCHWILSALKYIVIHTIFIEIHCCLHRNTLWPRPSRKYLFIWLCGQRYDLTIQTKVWQSGQIWQPYCPNEYILVFVNCKLQICLVLKFKQLWQMRLEVLREQVTKWAEEWNIEVLK